MTRRRAGWAALALVVAVALVVGVAREQGPRSNAERIDALAAQIKCPTCRSESVAESQAPASVNIREEIARQVSAGRPDGEILAAIDEQFGPGLLLTPPTDGVGSLVWILPVAALVVAVGGLAVAFARWRRAAVAVPSEEDRALVEAALHRR